MSNLRDNKKTAQIRKKLIDIREKCMKLSDSRANARKPVVLDQQAFGRISRVDAIQNQEIQLETERRRQLEINRVNSALNRLKTGQYGVCVFCNDHIEEERLNSDPSVPTCFACAEKRY